MGAESLNTKYLRLDQATGLLIYVLLAWQQWNGLSGRLVLWFRITNLCCLSLPELRYQQDLQQTESKW